MKSVLIVKMTSMGDLIHTLPAITDARRAYPEIVFDWVADESFADVPTWHPAVRQVYKTAHRRWRRSWTQTFKDKEINRFIKQLREHSYDMVIDAQSNFKSAIVTRLAKGERVGYDKASCAESIAVLAYQRKLSVAKGNHAVARLRQLFAKALGYEHPTQVDFGIDPSRFVKPDLVLPERYVFFTPNASWESKLWPEHYWQALIKQANTQGLSVVLPAGNDAELARAKRLAAEAPNVVAMPRLALSQVAYVIANAAAAVNVDTGLNHLCAACTIPSVSLYGATDSGLIGGVGANQVNLQADFPCAPCYKKHCDFQGNNAVTPACFEALSPERVWDQLQRLLVDSK